MAGYNPIESVDSVAMPCCPKSFEWTLQDVSSPNSGRTENIRMQKMRIGQVVGLSLTFKMPSIATGATLLTMFNPEYVTVKYLDAMAGTMVTSMFYTGDRKSTLFNTEKGCWESITFNLIKRDGAM